MPTVLAFDTATARVSCCLWRDGEVLAERHAAHPRAAQGVLSLIDDVLGAAGVGRSEIEGVAVGVGPGSFTSVRIGIATARGLALGLGVPVAGASSLAALRASSAGAIAVIDARRGELFVAGPGRDPAVITPAGLAAELAPGQTLVGDGAVRYRDVLACGSIEPDQSLVHAPSAAAIAERFRDRAPAEALYLRQPDATAVR